MFRFWYLLNWTEVICSVNEVVPKDKVVPAAIEWAKRIVEASPDSVRATKRALLMTNQIADVEELLVKHADTPEMKALYGGENIKVWTCVEH